MTSVANRFLSVDPHMKNAFSSTVKFDMGPAGPSPLARVPASRKTDINEAVEVAIRANPPREWELDVRALTSSRKWLQNYGLKKGRLQLNQILPAIGFKLSDEFDETLKKPVSSRYGGGLFRHLMRADGKTFNVSCSKDKLIQLEKRLLQAIYLFRRRLEWLTTESRRTFGVVEERAVTVVLDIRNMSPQQFDQYRTALERVLREQVSQLAKFNLIRASEDIQLYSPDCAPVSHDTLENAIQWLWNLDRLAPVSNTSATEAILAALSDQHNEAVYLFTEGTSIDSGKEVLLEKVSTAKTKVPINVVSFNCDSSNTIKFLKDFVKTTGGKFHAYAVVMELDAYEAQPADGVTSKANILLRRKTFGGIPAGAGVREDVVLVFEEMEQARNNLAQVRMLIENAPDPNRASKGIDPDLPQAVCGRDEQYMSSREWLDIYGLNSRKLGLYDVLSGVAFKHQDGVVDVMHRPATDTQTDAVVQQKLINARYCEQFPVVRWKDGRVVHVQVTPEVHRSYEERVMVALNKIQQRVDWLNQGSRALFGTLCEDQLYVLVDTSASMQPSLGFVKQKLFVLMQEQLRHKKKFNIVTFNSKAAAWKDRLVDVSERSLQSAWSWVQNLSCWGSTNTYAAIQLAMSDPQTQAIYLLSDGRPDQPPKSIIAQVHMKQHIPIHTISFNCEDREANQFLFDLSEATGGRYHYFNDRGKPVDQPESWESVDIKLLKEEMRRGFENLDKLADLRDECTSLAWKRETDSLRQSIETAREVKEGLSRSAMPPLDPKDLYRPNTPPHPPATPPPPRPSSAGPSVSRTSHRSDGPPDVSDSLAPARPTPPPPRPGSAEGPRLRGSGGLPQKLPRRPKSAKVSVSRKPMIAGHTRTSLLRTLNSSGRFSPNEWLLPETKQLFQLQVERQRDMAKRIEKKEEVRTKRSKKLLKANQMSSKQWLSRHGLLTQRLTILDALGSTFVPHRPKYISILDKHVMSKVFDEVLPIAHVSKSQQVRLVNPNGVNLKDYETKLQAALDKYRQRLNTIVWNALSEDAKEQFDSSTPVDFEENTEKLYRLLEEADWPVREQDVSLLAREIARAQKFLGQSQALRKAAAGEGDDDDDEEDEEDDDERDDKSDQGKEEDNEPPVSSARSNSPRSNKSEASPTRSEAGSKDDEGVGQVIRSVDKSCEGRVKESSQVIRRKVKVKLDTLRRQKVIARRDQDGLYYPAVVQQCSDPRHASVIYDDGTHAHVLTRNVIPTGGAVARPPLTSGDCVLMRVVNLDSDTECYVPAIVQHGPHRQEAHSKFFSVLMYNGQKASTLRSYLVKISKERFELASMYIADQHNENRKDVEDLVYVSSPRFPKKGKTSSRKSADTRCDLSFTCDLPFTCDLYINRDLLTRTRSRSRSPSSEDSRPSSRESRHSVKEQKQTRSRSNSPSDGYESKGDSQDESGKSWRRESHRERQTDKLTTVKEEEKAQRRAGDTSPTLSEVESEGKRSEKSPQGSSAPGSRSSTPRNDSGDRNKESVRSQTSRSSELERLKQELLHQQARQERQKKKLKKKAKRLQRREKELTLKEEQDAADALVTPSADEGSTPRLIQLRKTLAQLRPGEEVLARWSDDGWYYRGMVRQSHDDCSYSLEDSTGFVERIWREDIISENDNADAVYELDHKVVALHPDYSFSYAPAAVTGVTDSEVEVRFYDARSARLPWSEAYHVTGEKYQQDVTYIAKRESELVGAAVVARDDETGAYYPGCVRRKEEDSCDYLISWSDGSVSVQSAVHIFSAFTRRRPLTVGDRVLAMADPVHVQFLPGHIAGSVDGKLVVQFCDGEMREGVDLTLCYWLGQQYYDMALQYYKAREPRHR